MSDTITIARRLSDHGHFTREQADDIALLINDLEKERLVTRDYLDRALERQKIAIGAMIAVATSLLIAAEAALPGFISAMSP